MFMTSKEIKNRHQNLIKIHHIRWEDFSYTWRNCIVRLKEGKEELGRDRIPHPEFGATPRACKRREEDSRPSWNPIIRHWVRIREIASESIDENGSIEANGKQFFFRTKKVLRTKKDRRIPLEVVSEEGDGRVAEDSRILLALLDEKPQLLHLRRIHLRKLRGSDRGKMVSG